MHICIYIHAMYLSICLSIFVHSDVGIQPRTRALCVRLLGMVAPVISEQVEDTDT